MVQILNYYAREGFFRFINQETVEFHGLVGNTAPAESFLYSLAPGFAKLPAAGWVGEQFRKARR